jgi:hypothetical protein
VRFNGTLEVVYVHRFPINEGAPSDPAAIGRPESLATPAVDLRDRSRMPLLPLTQNQPLDCVNYMPFQKGNQLAKGNQFAKNSTNQRRDTTIELIAQLNEQTTRKGGKKNLRVPPPPLKLVSKE